MLTWGWITLAESTGLRDGVLSLSLFCMATEGIHTRRLLLMDHSEGLLGVLINKRHSASLLLREKTYFLKRLENKRHHLRLEDMPPFY